MKLESLKSSKFEAFKASEIVNAMSIKGGACTPTQCAGDVDATNPDWTKSTVHGKTDRDEADTKLHTSCIEVSNPGVNGGFIDNGSSAIATVANVFNP